jgi:hypothetical protein
MKQFSPATTAQWASQEFFHDPDDTLVSEFVSLYSPKKEGSADSSDLLCKTDNWEYEYTVDVRVKNSSEEKMSALGKALEEYGYL